MKLVLAGVLALGLGYGVYSMTAGKAEEPKGKTTAKADAKEEKSWASEAASKTKGLLASIGDEEETLEPDATVACQRGDNTVYMHEGDCLNQGGRVLFRKR